MQLRYKIFSTASYPWCRLLLIAIVSLAAACSSPEDERATTHASSESRYAVSRSGMIEKSIPMAATPADVPIKDAWHLYQNAMSRADGKQVASVLSRRMLENQVFEFYYSFAARDDYQFLNKYFDNTTLELEIAAVSQQAPESAPASTEALAGLMLKHLKDRDAFLSAAISRLNRFVPPHACELRHVTIEGDRARGTITRYVTGLKSEGGVNVPFSSPVDASVSFVKEQDGWKLDLPTEAETLDVMKRTNEPMPGN